MFKSFMLSALLTLTCPKVNTDDENFPKNLTAPHYQVDAEGNSLKYWIVLEPKCIIETVYNRSKVVATEITFLDPEHTNQNLAIALVELIENIDPSKNPMTFGGMNREENNMITITDSNHIILWERNKDNQLIVKVTILYHQLKPDLKS